MDHATATPTPPQADEPKPTVTKRVLPPHPPVITDRQPAPGAEQRLEEPIAIAFDQPMDRGSVERAFDIQPAVPGDFRWQDNTLFFQPRAAQLARNAFYTVSIGEAAQNDQGQPLANPTRFEFRTVGYLEVTGQQPPSGAEQVEVETDIQVGFNRPVVPLVGVGEQQDLSAPLEIMPAVQGAGEWVNTSIYVLRPAEPLLPGTEYTVRVPAGLTDTTGGQLESDHTWSFVTELPTVVETDPFDSAQFVPPTTTITVTLSYAMNRALTEAAFSLLDAQGQTISGAFRWKNDSTFVFSPASPLILGERYTGRLADTAQGMGGARGLAQEYAWQFRVIEAPRVVSTKPADGDMRADPYTSLRITFSSPMDPATLQGNLDILPEPKQVYTSWSRSQTQLWISFGAQPSTRYKVTLGPELAGRYGHQMGSAHTLVFATRALSPRVSLTPASRLGMYNAYDENVVYAHPLNVSRVSFALYQQSVDAFIRLNGENWWEIWQDYQPLREDLLHAWSQEVSVPLNEEGRLRVPLDLADGSPLPAGLYYLEASAPGVQDPVRHLLVVTRTNLAIKHSQEEILVWATDLSSGDPVAGLDLQIRSMTKGDAQGQTDEKGVFRAEIAAYDAWEPLFVIAQRDGITTVALSNWNNGLQPWQYDLNTGWDDPPYRGVVYTDRPIYRPDQTVYFKGIIRRDRDGQYSVPDLSGIDVRVIDSTGKEIYAERLSVSPYGTFYGELALAQEAALGRYHIEVSTENEAQRLYISHSFQVAEYRKPEFLVEVETDRDEYIQGDTIAVHVKAEYFFGGGLQEAQVQWRLLGQRYRFSWDGEGWWDFRDQDLEDWERPWTPYGELITEGRGHTNGEGEFIFRLPADVGTRQSSQLFTIEATVTDANNQETSARTSVIVHKGRFYIGLQPESYVNVAGQEAKVNVITVDTQGITVTNVPLDIIVYEHRWYSVQERDPDGRLRWVTKAEDTPVLTSTLTTDAQGQSTLTFVPESGGVYRVQAKGRDERGNQISASTYLWVSAEEFTSWRRENHKRMDLVADKKRYVPGDVAQILIPSPFQGEPKALVTIERGRILEHRVITLQSNSEQIAVPIEAAHIPNVYVSVLIVQGQAGPGEQADFRMGYVSLPVSPQSKRLRIEVTPAQDRYRPGDTAEYDIQVTGQQGQGVESELSLALVDLSVLTLSGDQGPNLLQRFYQERPLGVQSAVSLALAADERVQKEADETRAKGGGQGGIADGMAVRRDFPDTVYWDPAWHTSPDGTGQVRIELAGNLTTWRLRAQGITVDLKVGDAQVDIVATKALLIRPVAPRFFVVGDQAELAAIVHNNTESDIEATVTLETTGVEVGQPTHQVLVPADGMTKVTWPATVQAAEQAELVFSVQGGGLEDAATPLFGTLPIYRYSAPELVATSGQVEAGEQRIEIVQLPADADTTQGSLQLTLEPSLAAGMEDSLYYLEHYPYDCVEQTVSRFLPAVVAYQALQSLGLQDSEREAELPIEISKALQRLYALQHVDGGWGWWAADASQPYLTAYVLFGLTEAEYAGFGVDAAVMKKAVSFLEESLNKAKDLQQGYQANSRAFVLYVLANYYAEHEERGDLGRAVTLFEQRQALDSYGKAYLALALDLLAPEEQTRINTLVSDLSGSAIQFATGAHWEERGTDYRAMNTDVRSTAIVLRTLVTLDPDHSLIPRAVRWLMASRTNGRWLTTQENVWSILALTDYMLVSGELAADYTYRVALNGQLWAEGAFGSEDIDETRELQVAVAALLHEQSNQVWIERDLNSAQSGQGTLYYSAHLRYFLPVEAVEAVNRGVILQREYRRFESPEQTLESARVGDVIQVKLTIIAPHDIHYLVIEDPLPAGCEAVDTSLETTSAAYDPAQLAPAEQSPWSYLAYLTHTELRDEKVTLFATRLPQGTYEYTYLMRASLPGQYRVLPTTGYAMYFPEIFGHSDGDLLSIEPD